MPRKKTGKGERKYEELRGGRVYWRSGEEHPLDKLYDERDELRALLPDQLTQLQRSAQQTEERLRAILQATQTSDNPAALFTPADHAAHEAIFERFYNRKHYEHLHAHFTIQRYRRLLGRLQAIQAALNLANGLLDEETILSPEYLAALQDQQADQDESDQADEQLVTLPAAISDDQTDQGEQDQAEPTSLLTPEELRLQGIEEPLTAIVGSVERSHELLRDFEAKLPDLRRQLATGQGWFEVFHVPKRRYKPEVRAYAEALERWYKHKTPIPEEVEQAVHPRVRELIQAGVEKFPPELREEVYDIVEVGPYVKYRWREEKQLYTISLGLDSDYPSRPFVSEGF